MIKLQQAGQFSNRDAAASPDLQGRGGGTGFNSKRASHTEIPAAGGSDKDRQVFEMN